MPSTSHPTRPLTILVSKGVGTGPNPLAAFDSALHAAGVADRNLVRLSSVIPPHSRVVVPGDPPPAPGAWGDRLYVVYAAAHAILRGHEAWASVGWVQDSVLGHGLFVEHEGDNEEVVEHDVESSLAALCVTRGMTFDVSGKVTVGARCAGDGSVACALVVATFEAATWERAL